MSTVASQREDGDGISEVSLAELIALRARVGSARMAPLSTRAARHGQQSSRLYGRGMDYAESRVYQAGDDVRRLDWRLTARSGKLHTKLFQEDREGCLLILLDTHASMHFGTRARFKSVQAARAAALAAWFATRAGERVAMLGFGGVDQWLADWNAHDLDALLAHYGDGVIFTSPLAERLLPGSGGVARGKDELRAYWTAGLAALPDLRFEVLEHYVGVSTIVIRYRNQSGGVVCKVLEFEDDLVVRGHGTYLAA